MVGLAPHTIRAWERRHAVVAPGRSNSRQRRYRLEDVEVLKRVKDLASARGLSLRLAVAEALGESPQLASIEEDRPGPAQDMEEGAGPWRAVADLDPRLLLILDHRGEVLDCNVAFARVAGELRFELRGRRFSQLVEPYDRAKAVTIHRGTPQDRRGWELNLQTEATVGLFSFDCVPLPYRDRWLIALAGHRVA